VIVHGPILRRDSRSPRASGDILGGEGDSWSVVCRVEPAKKTVIWFGMEDDGKMRLEAEIQD